MCLTCSCLYVLYTVCSLCASHMRAQWWHCLCPFWGRLPDCNSIKFISNVHLDSIPNCVVHRKKASYQHYLLTRFRSMGRLLTLSKLEVIFRGPERISQSLLKVCACHRSPCNSAFQPNCDLHVCLSKRHHENNLHTTYCKKSFLYFYFKSDLSAWYISHIA